MVTPETLPPLERTTWFVLTANGSKLHFEDKNQAVRYFKMMKEKGSRVSLCIRNTMDVVIEAAVPMPEAK